AFHASLTPEQETALHAAGDAESIRAVVEQVRPDAPLRAKIAAALAELCPNGETVAVRSSASDEDGAQHSFAGQLDSFLFVPPAEVAGRVADVWRSGFGA